MGIDRERQIEGYLRGGWKQIRGMTGAFGLGVMSTLLRAQAADEIKGDLLEVGGFEGRVTILLGLHGGRDETAWCVDPFTWPCPCVAERILINLVQYQVAGRTTLVKSVSSEFDWERPRPLRFVHLDGSHEGADLLADLRGAASRLAPSGVIVVDDMVHPEYPELTAACLKFLAESEDLALCCVVDRESFISSAKFVITHAKDVRRYDRLLRAEYPDHIYPWGAKVAGSKHLLLASEVEINPM